MPYKIEFGRTNDRKAKLGLKTTEIIPAYDRLVASGESGIVIFSPDGSTVEPHALRLAVGGNR